MTNGIKCLLFKALLRSAGRGSGACDTGGDRNTSPFCQSVKPLPSSHNSTFNVPVVVKMLHFSICYVMQLPNVILNILSVVKVIEKTLKIKSEISNQNYNCIYFLFIFIHSFILSDQQNKPIV